MGWTEVWQYSKLVKCPLENQYFASYIDYFDRICIQTYSVFEDIHIFLSCFSIYHISFFGKDLKGTEWNLNFEEKVIYLFVKAWYTEGKNFRLRAEFSRTKKKFKKFT